jgi:hypothetical protein
MLSHIKGLLLTLVNSGKYEMKGFIGVTDNEWCAYVILLKQDWPKAQGSRRKAVRSNWAKGKNEFRDIVDPG